MMINKDFTVFILTHGRADNVITLKTLRSCGYTGLIYFIVDNEDKQQDKYIENFGAEYVKVFDKKKYADLVDEGNNFDERRTITHARNACFDIAREIGIKYFIELDDDYTAFDYLIPGSEKFHNPIKNLDSVFDIMLSYYIANQISTMAFIQGGDLIGGVDNFHLKSNKYPFIKRKAMNSFICSTERQFQFVGAMNEDVNTFTTKGSRGLLFFTIPLVSLTQKTTQSQEGGITDMYLLYGTYCKAFTTVMMMPSCVKVGLMGDTRKRIHHTITWKNTVPVILSETYKK